MLIGLGNSQDRTKVVLYYIMLRVICLGLALLYSHSNIRKYFKLSLITVVVVFIIICLLYIALLYIIHGSAMNNFGCNFRQKLN